MTDFDYQSRLLHLTIKENEEKYISGELDLDEPLRKTEELYDHAYETAKKDKTCQSSMFSNDSGLMQLQSKIVHQRARCYKPGTLVFDPREFSEKLAKYFTGIASNEERESSHRYSMIWQKLGEESQEKMHFAPTFDFLYGTFTAEPVSPVKKKRKRIEKDKVANAVKPKTVDMAQCKEKRDPMLHRAEFIYSLLMSYTKRSSKKSICFYEFVIDPHSFSRTIENIFSVTFLLRNGNVCIFSDEQGLPWIRSVTMEEKQQRVMDPKENMQSVLSMSLDEWKTIIQKCNFREAKIPPPKPKTAEEK